MTIVVGSGPAGLTAAYLLAKRGERVTVIEKADKPGGLWRGFEYPGGIRFEAGMHWYTDCGIPEIDGFWWGLLPPDQIHVIEREIAGCWWDGCLQTNSPYPDVRGGKQFDNKPVLEKLWGVPIDELSDDAGKLIKIDRAVAYDEATTAAAYAREPKLRDVLAWPDQRTLPEQYRSGRRSFYPKGGMVALVDAAVARLLKMGVAFRFRAAFLHPPHDEPLVWAAGLYGIAQKCGVEWPAMTPPRRLSVVNVLMDEKRDHDLHYAFSYGNDPVFRTTWYENFTTPFDRRVSIEMLTDAAWNTEQFAGKVLGHHSLGPVLPVPTKANEAAAEGVRAKLAEIPNLKLIGAGAKAGLFYQGELLRHVAEVCG